MRSETQRNDHPIITLRSTVRTRATADAVYDILADISTHAMWGGEQTGDKRFRLLTLQAPGERAGVGSRFSSTGVVMMGTFHDASVVVEASRAAVFAFHTHATLDRKHRATWHAAFDHRYIIENAGEETLIRYTCDVHPRNYVPFWFSRLARPMTRWSLQRVIGRCVRNLAAMAEAQRVMPV